MSRHGKTGLLMRNRWMIIASFGRMTSQPPEELASAHQIEDLGRRFVIPGLIDAHIHVGMMGECAEYVSLAGKGYLVLVDTLSRATSCMTHNEGIHGLFGCWPRLQVDR